MNIIRNKHYGVRLFLSFFIIVIMSIFILSSFLYSGYSKAAHKNATYLAIDKLKQSAFASNYAKKSSVSTILQIYVNDNSGSFFNNNNPTYYEINQMRIKALDSYLISTESVHSITAYNGKNGVFSSTRLFNEAAETEFINNYVYNLVSNKKSIRKISPIPRRLQDSVDRGDDTVFIDVFSYIMFDFDPQTKMPLNAVVYNLRKDWLQDFITSNEQSINTTIVLDHQGRIVSHPDPSKFLQVYTGNAPINQILNTKTTSGNIPYLDNGEKHLLVYYYDKVLDWYFISLISDVNLLKGIEEITNYIIIVTLAVMIIGLILSFIFTRSTYKPIKKLTQRAATFIENGSQYKVKDEFDFIHNVFTEREKQIDSLNVTKRKDQYVVKKHLFQKMLQSPILPSSHYQLLELLKRLDPDVVFSQKTPKVVILIVVDNYIGFCKDYNYETRNLHMFSIANIAHELLSQNFTTYCFERDNGYVDVLIDLGNTSTDNYVDSFKDILSSIQENVQKFLNLSVSVVIGPVVNDIFHINDSYNIAMKLATNKIKYPYRSTIFQENINSLQASRSEYDTTKEARLIEFLKQGHFDEANALIDNMIKKAIDNDIDTFRTILLKIATAISNAVSSLENTYQEDIPCSINSVLSHLYEYDTLKDIQEMFSGAVSDVTFFINATTDDKSDKYINDVELLLEKNYNDKNLSLTMLAEELGLSPIYLGRIYKMHTGTSVANKLKDLRLNKAKDLLTLTDIPIVDICEGVGFINISHFYKVFKKATGITPAHYRKNLHE